MTKYQLEHTNGINNPLTFGKFKGKTILQVIRENPSYIVWCIRNIPNFNIDETLSKELCKQYDEYRHNKEDKDIIIKLINKPYNMNSIEAMNYLEYDMPEHW